MQQTRAWGARVVANGQSDECLCSGRARYAPSDRLASTPRLIELTPKSEAFLLVDLKVARERLEERTAALAEIANWRNRLRRKIANAQPDSDLRQIAAEVRAFKSACRALARRP
jgi:hypothetical protein